jgi:hypothetical protein
VSDATISLYDLRYLMNFVDEVDALLDADIEGIVFHNKHEDMVKVCRQLLKGKINEAKDRARASAGNPGHSNPV